MLKLKRGERLWLSLDGGGVSAQACFSIALPRQQAVVAGLARLAARVVSLVRDGWRTV